MDIEVVLDCADLDRSTTFWSAALGYEHAGSAEQYSVLRDREGRRPRLLLQRVDEPKTGKNRAHFDLTAPDIDQEATRLEGLGARRVPDGHLTELGTEWIQMVDPEGNEFCVCKPFEDTTGRPVLGVRPALHRYVLDHAPIADPIAQALIDETAALGLVSRMQIAKEQGDLMRIMTRLIGAQHALEVGTFTGYSALCVARGLPEDGTLLCCDVSEEWTSVGRKYWEAAGVAHKIDLRIGPAIDTLRALPDGEQLDLAFIDADKPSYAGYFDEIIPRLRSGGLLMVDNVLWGGSVVDPQAVDENATAIRAFNDKVAADPRVESMILAISDGITLARKL
jgi:predicted O-methyltransferase YrrM/predicted enzyme related to lactoylglutathione lyase